MNKPILNKPSEFTAGLVSSGAVYTQRHLPKWVYRRDEHVMICVDTRVDGNKLLRIFDANKECTDPELRKAYLRRWGAHGPSGDQSRQEAALVQAWQDEFIIEIFNERFGGFVGHCTLCGNSGKIDTRGRATLAGGVNCGSVVFCICPNGRALKHVVKVPK